MIKRCLYKDTTMLNNDDSMGMREEKKRRREEGRVRDDAMLYIWNKS